MPEELPEENVEEVFEEIEEEFEVEEEQAKQEEAAPVEEEKLAEKPFVSLQVFLQLCGLKWDRTAGFKHYAIKQKLGPMPVLDWHDELQNFMKKPV